MPHSDHRVWKLNTSNPGKLEEYQRIFSANGYSLVVTDIDLREIDADPISVIIHKASQMGDDVLVEDTSLDVEGSDVGVNVRWLLEHLSSLIGRRARWCVYLAYQRESVVFVYEGVVYGTIVEAKGSNGYGFDPVFLPDGSEETLGQNKPDAVNARWQAAQALFENTPCAVAPVLKEWDGPWQG